MIKNYYIILLAPCSFINDTENVINDLDLNVIVSHFASHLYYYYCYFYYYYCYFHYYYYYYYYYYDDDDVLRKLMGKPWGFSAEDVILCQNGRMSHEKQWNDLHIYVKSGVIVYPEPRIHNSVAWAWSRVGE